MNRREVIKGAAMLALAQSAIAKKPRKDLDCNPILPTEKSLLIYLQGPFAILFHGDPANVSGVTAFSPIDSRHLLKVMKMPCPVYPSRNHWSLDRSGLNVPDKPCISSDFNSFLNNHLGPKCDPEKDSLIRILLPCPTNVWTAKLRLGKLGDTRVCIPLDYVLEYEIKEGQPTLYYDEARQNVLPSKNVFHIELGLPEGSHDPIGHAIDFYNNSILGCFSTDQKQLTEISEHDSCPPNIPEDVALRLPSKYSKGTTLECTSGGLMGYP